MSKRTANDENLKVSLNPDLYSIGNNPIKHPHIKKQRKYINHAKPMSEKNKQKQKLNNRNPRTLHCTSASEFPCTLDRG